MCTINTYRFLLHISHQISNQERRDYMQQTAEITTTLSLASLIYKTAKMGGEAITDTLPKIKDGKREGDSKKIREELSRQFAEYEKIASEAERFLESSKVQAKEENVLVKMASKAGIMMNTMKDPSPSHIAEMMVKGLSMGITEMTAKARESKEKGCDEDILQLAERLISFQEDAVDKIKAFL